MEPIDIPDFLKSQDYTLNSETPTCVGVFIDPVNVKNVTLQTINCLSKVFAFCEIKHGFDEYTSNRGLPTVPCVQSNARRKRETRNKRGKELK